ncbi:hypothetical protein [Nonomuraea fuscirosea]|uniref:hypothetical protein n=1 Tax=Nonomuraea fuscirosea TaxID=1291556 RepID=UPI00342A8E5C
MSTVLAAFAAVMLAAGLGGTIAVAAAEPKALGFCAKQTGGALRLLEPKNIAKSQWGKCMAGETRRQLPTTVAKARRATPDRRARRARPVRKGDASAPGKDGKDGRGFDGAPFKMTFTGNGPWSCTWKATTDTLDCVTP